MNDKVHEALEKLLFKAFESGWFDNTGDLGDGWSERKDELLSELDAALATLPGPREQEPVLKAARAELGRLGNALNWDNPITEVTSGVINAISNQYGTGVLDDDTDSDAVAEYLARASPTPAQDKE